MFSVDNFYDYLRHCYDLPKNFYLLRSFYPHGSTDLPLLFQNHPARILRFNGFCDLYDQEPLYLDDIGPVKLNNYEYRMCPETYNFFSGAEFMYRHAAGVFCPIIAHSEKNSQDIQELVNNDYAEVHYWYHGLVSRDWYRHWKHFYKSDNINKKRFGLYLRDCSGKRKYRFDLLKDLSKISNSVHYYMQENVKLQLDDKNLSDISNCWPVNKNIYNSDSSASITWSDTGLFDLHIVAETVFDSSGKVHLTEKILRSIAMMQPFILFGNPNSLEYLKSYGFKTFSSCWDESYDSINNKDERYQKIIDLIYQLNSLSNHKYNALIEKTKQICEFNRRHFYSDTFEDMLLNELHSNFNLAFLVQNEKFYTKPGGTFFEMMNTIGSADLPNLQKQRMRTIIKFMENKWPTVVKEIIKKYNHLF